MKLFNYIKTKLSASQSNPYEGATRTRRLGSWGLDSPGPNLAIENSLPQLRSRARDLQRNNPWVNNAVRSLCSNLIGCGITPRWLIDCPKLKDSIQTAWSSWTYRADFDERYDFYGIQMLVAQILMTSGEVLVRFVVTKNMPLQLQVLEPDFIADDLNQTLANGNFIRMGIEFSPAGKRVAYHLYKTHPDDGDYRNQFNTTRIKASNILHIYRTDRAGQIRGVPWISSVLLKLRELDEYEDAELVRKKTAALFSGFITEPALDFNQPDVDGHPELPLQPGTLKRLAPGENIEFSEPADVGGSYEAWMKQQLRGIAMGIGLTYEQLTGDLHGVNYSSIRAGLIEFRRQIESLQHHIIIRQLCQPVALKWLELAYLSGEITLPNPPNCYHRIEWQPPGWDWVDPEKDIKAEILAMTHNLKARQDIIAKYGLDAEEVDRKIAQDNKRAKELNIDVNELATDSTTNT